MQFRVCISVLMLFLLSSLANTQETTSQKDANHVITHKWVKGVIKDAKLYCILPTKIPYTKQDSENMDRYSKYEQPKMLVFSQSDVTSNVLKYEIIPTKGNGSETLTLVKTAKRYPALFEYYPKYLPPSWDMSNRDNIIVSGILSLLNNDIDISVTQKKISLIWSNNEAKNLLHSGNYNTILYEPYNSITHKNMHKFIDSNGNTKYEKMALDNNNGIMINVIANTDKTADVFLLNSNQILVWNTIFNINIADVTLKWKFQYAFKMPRNCHFEVCRIGNDLYMLTKEFGIYKLNEFEAKKNAPASPKDVFLTRGSFVKFSWDGFDQEHIKSNKDKADKISDLTYDRFIVDRDRNTAYIIANGYLYELNNLKIRSKIPEFSKAENFISEESEYMRAALQAIYNLGVKPEQTPDELLKITPESEVDKLIAENVSKKANNLASDEYTTSKDDNDGDRDTMSNKMSDNTDMITYVSIAAGILVFITLIFVLFIRKRN